MTFEYRDDASCDKLVAQPDTDDDRKPVVFISTTGLNKGVYVPLDRVEEVIAGLRGAARTASGQQPKPAVAYGDGKGRVYCQRCAPTVEAASVPLTVNHVDHWELCPSCGRHVVDVARETPAVGQPAEAHDTEALADTERCPSCEHGPDIHDADGRCWFTVEHGVPGCDLVCPCKIRRQTVEDAR